MRCTAENARYGREYALQGDKKHIYALEIVCDAQKVRLCPIRALSYKIRESRNYPLNLCHPLLRLLGVNRDDIFGYARE